MAGQWDIFCAVVDNYGDIGVTLRLARQLVAEQGVAVRLWVDDLRALQPLSPATSLTAAQQWLEGVEVRAWTAEAVSGVEPGEVVIEAFACELPAAFIAAMAAQPRPPLWLNLEYLSAEDWVAGCHALAVAAAFRSAQVLLLSRLYRRDRRPAARGRSAGAP